MTKTVISTTLDEANQAVFSDRSLCIGLLKNYSQVISTLAHWLYEEWHPFDNVVKKYLCV